MTESSRAQAEDGLHFPPPTGGEEKNPKGSLVAVLCVNSVGQVMEQGVMLRQQHQPWVVPPDVLADGTKSAREQKHAHARTHIFTNDTSRRATVNIN